MKSMGRKRLFTALFFGLFTGLSIVNAGLKGAERSVPIPGIDNDRLTPATGKVPKFLPVTEGAPPVAPQQEAKPSAESRREAPATTPEKTKPDEPVREAPEPEPEPEPEVEYPFVSNIKVTEDKEYPRSVRINWSIRPNNDTAIYITRSDRPISDEKRLFNALNITSPPLGPSETTFLDRGLPTGTYYYAIITSFEIAHEGKMKLIASKNYTVEPVVIYEEEGRKEETKPISPPKADGLVDDAREEVINDYMVDSLVAVNSENSVKLSWIPAKAEDVEYNIYRSYGPLDTVEAFRKAKKLGKTSAENPSFQDQSPAAERRIYYGVSTSSLSSGREFLPLKFQSSYVSHTFRRKTGLKKVEDLFPVSLKAEKGEDDSVRLTWKDAGARLSAYRIFRSSMPVYSRRQLGQAIALGKVEYGKEQYIDEKLPPGRYFYAIFPVKTNGRTVEEFVEGRTFTGFAVTIEKEEEAKQAEKRDLSEQYTISDLQAEDRQDGVLLTWNPVSGTDALYTIYRIPRTADGKGRMEDAKLVGYAQADSPRFLDKNAIRGESVFYYVTATNQKTGNEFRVFKYKKTYITHTFGEKASAPTAAVSPGENIDSIIPQALMAYQASADSVKLLWVSGERPPAGGYMVYRSNRPIANAAELKKSDLLTVVPASEGGYVDPGMDSGRYFYSVIPADSTGSPLLAFIEGRTYIGSPVEIVSARKEIEKEPRRTRREKGEVSAEIPVVEYFQAGFDGNSVVFSWAVKASAPPRKPSRIQLYEGERILNDLNSLRRYGMMVEDFGVESTGHRVLNPKSGFHYYALVVEYDGRLQEPLITGINYLPGPVFVRKESKIEDAVSQPQEKETPAEEEKTEPEAAEEEPVELARRIEKIEKKPEEKTPEPVAQAPEDTYKVPDDLYEPLPEPVTEIPRREYVPDDLPVGIVRRAIELYKDPIDRVNAVIAATYMKKKYKEAVESLSYFVNDRSLPMNVRGRAMFYMGMSYYEMNEYRKAMIIFMTEEVRSEFPDRSRFWYNRSLEMLR